MNFAKRTITVSGVDVEVNRTTLQINDIDEAQRTSAKLMAFWASVWGSAEAEREAADAFYREWRAKATERILKADSKLSEWKVRAKIESHADFLKLKTALSQAIDHATTSKAMFEACGKRANLAQSLGAKARETYRKTGEDRTKSTTSDDDDDDSGPAPDSSDSRPTVKKSGHDTAKRNKLANILKGRKNGN